MESDYAEVALGRVREIFSRPNQMQMIPWAQEQDDELTYNQKLAEVNDGVCLDRALISIRSRKSRIEDCDVLLERGVSVHVKRTDGSASASHLIAQAHEGPGEDPALGAFEEVCQGATGLGIGQRECRRQVADDGAANPLSLEAGIEHGHGCIFVELGKLGNVPIREASHVVCSRLMASSASAATRGQSSSLMAVMNQDRLFGFLLGGVRSRSRRCG
ncbi:DUF6119 family protein, partial [Actinomyces bowdenii]|uniref:DUF6119 family protein n=1 Tax=Actinomyces bowdenii TaxID=131109 RepID=UPI0035A36B41